MRSRLMMALVVSLLAAVVPLATLADEKVPIACSLTLAVTDPGSSVVHGGKVRTTGEETQGALDCDLDALDGLFTSIHSSKIEVDPATGGLSGKLQGSFSVATGSGTLSGRVKADISGVIIGLAPSPPFPPGTPVYSVTDVGTWKLESGGMKGKGTFNVTLVGVLGIPASLGGLATPLPGSLQGHVALGGE